MFTNCRERGFLTAQARSAAIRCTHTGGTV